MEMTPEAIEKIRKNEEILKSIRLKGENPKVYFLKSARKTNAAELYEIVAEWFVPLPEDLSFKEAYESELYPRDRLLTIRIPRNYLKECGLALYQDVYFPKNIGFVSQNSYSCLGLSKEEVFQALKQDFQTRIENIDKRMRDMQKSRENLFLRLSELMRKEDG